MQGRVRLRLYVARGTTSSASAVRTLEAALADSAAGTELEIVDVFDAPARAFDDGIFVTPTLIRIQPGPPVRVIGDLSRPGALSRLFP